MTAALKSIGCSDPVGQVGASRLMVVYQQHTARGDRASWQRAATLYALVHGLGIRHSQVARGVGETPTTVRHLAKTFAAFWDPESRPQGLRFEHFRLAATTADPAAWIAQAAAGSLSVPQMRRRIAEARRAATVAAAAAPSKSSTRAALVELLRAGAPVTASALQTIAKQQQVAYATVLGILGALQTPAPNADLVKELETRVNDTQRQLVVARDEAQRILTLLETRQRQYKEEMVATRQEHAQTITSLHDQIERMHKELVACETEKKAMAAKLNKIEQALHVA